MLARIDIWKIICDHFATLRRIDDGSKNMSINDCVIFIFLPLVLSSIFVRLGFSIKLQLSNLISAVSIFGGFLFNLLAIIYSQFDKIQKDSQTGQNTELKKRFIREIHSNISFCIVLSVFIVLVLFFDAIEIPDKNYWLDPRHVQDFVTFYLLLLLLFTTLMVINRVYILLKKDVENR